MWRQFLLYQNRTSLKQLLDKPVRWTIRFYKVSWWGWDTESKFAGWASTLNQFVIRVYVCTGRYTLHDMTDTCWKYCIFSINSMDAKMDILARNRTLSHMRTNEDWISKRNCALFIFYIYIYPYSRKQGIGFHANGGGLHRLHKCLSFQLAYVDSCNVRLLLQWPRQFELL